MLSRKVGIYDKKKKKKPVQITQTLTTYLWCSRARPNSRSWAGRCGRAVAARCRPPESGTRTRRRSRNRPPGRTGPSCWTGARRTCGRTAGTAVPRARIGRPAAAAATAAATEVPPEPRAPASVLVGGDSCRRHPRKNYRHDRALSRGGGQKREGTDRFFGKRRGGGATDEKTARDVRSEYTDDDDDDKHARTPHRRHGHETTEN